MNGATILGCLILLLYKKTKKSSKYIAASSRYIVDIVFDANSKGQGSFKSYNQQEQFDTGKFGVINVNLNSVEDPIRTVILQNVLSYTTICKEIYN